VTGKATSQASVTATEDSRAQGPSRRRVARGFSVRAKVLAAFLVLSSITAIVGSVAYSSLTQSGRLLADIYDRPLTEISFARQVLADFSRLEAAFNRAVLERNATRRETLRALHVQRMAELSEDLEVVEMRSTSARARRAASQVRIAVKEWLAVADTALAGSSAPDWTALDRRSAVVNEQIDLLVNFAAGDGFIARRAALQTVDRNTMLQVGATMTALALSIIVTLLLLRTILGPVATASNAAHRIAEGELDVDIPATGRDELGSLLDSMSVMRDNIRSMVEEEKSLRQLAQVRLVDAIESSAEGVAVVDREGRIVVANAQVTRILSPGSDRALTGQDFHAVVMNAVEQGVFASHEAADGRELVQRLESPGTTAMEEKLADGRWMHISRNRTADGGMIAIFSDITLHIEREDVLREAAERAEAGSRTKSEFLATMSHELRTPLNAVIGFSEFMVTETLGPVGHPKYREFLDDILGSARRLLAIINDILEWSKLDAGHNTLELAPVSLGPLIGDLNEEVAPMFEAAGVELRTGKEPTTSAMADRGKLLLILRNLLSNAAKFTPKGGSATVSVTEPADGWIAINVADTGIGMREEDIPVALAPFGQVDSRLARKYEGTGLGLALVKAYVERHGGTLAITTAPGKGTCVTVRLKAAEGDRTETPRDTIAA